METVKRNRIVSVILGLLQGIAIGVGGILPGISGGVLCIAFGIYKPIMEAFAAPVQGLKKHWRRLLPVAIGAGVGFFMLVSAVSGLLDSNERLATCVFAGLILGTLPSLVRTAAKEKRTAGSYVAFFASFIIFFALFIWLRLSTGVTIEPSFIGFVITGALWAISVVLPGLSSSAILIFLGLFEPMVDGVMAFDFGVLIPLAVGGAGTLILLARLVNMLYQKHFSIMSHIIIGIVVATTIPILPSSFSSVADAAVQISLVILGFVAAVVFDNISARVQ